MVSGTVGTSWATTAQRNRGAGDGLPTARNDQSGAGRGQFGSSSGGGRGGRAVGQAHPVSGRQTGHTVPAPGPTGDGRTMNFAFSEEQDELRSSVRRFLEDKSPEVEVRRLMETTEGYDPAVWAQMGDQL